MEHDEAVGLQLTEKYVLNELTVGEREAFEEHYFDCQECAAYVVAGASFVAQSRAVFREAAREAVPAPPQLVPARLPWWRSAVFAPAMAVLVALAGYQNLVTVPHLTAALNRPAAEPMAQVNLGVYSAGPEITALRGEGFALSVRIPPPDGYASYAADLLDPSKKVEWTVNIPATLTQQDWVLHVPGKNRPPGTYAVVLRGTTAAGASEDLGRGVFELQVQ